jgi:gas vesicle protein
MENIQHRTSYFLLGMVVGTLFGGMLGGLVALWLAPQSGKQLQKRVRKQGKALKRQADDALAHVSN